MHPPFFDGEIGLGILKMLSTDHLKALKTFIKEFGPKETIRIIDNEIRSRKPKVVKIRPKNKNK